MVNAGVSGLAATTVVAVAPVTVAVTVTVAPATVADTDTTCRRLLLLASKNPSLCWWCCWQGRVCAAPSIEHCNVSC
jgi:hypothetical protein